MKRRDFIRKSAGTTMAFALSGMIVTSQNAQAARKVKDPVVTDPVVTDPVVTEPAAPAVPDVSFSLTAAGTNKTMIDGATLFTWDFNDDAGASGPGALGSGMIVTEGDVVEVTLTNSLDRDVNFVVQGLTSGTTAVAPGTTQVYTFTASTAGTFMYTDDVNGFIGKAMGLSGPLIVMPADGSQTLGGAAFDSQYTMFMSDMDDRLNAAIAGGGTYKITDYEPNYYFVNGLIYPDTAADADTTITMNVGDDVGIRFVNAGVIEYPMHFHGYHANHVTTNRAANTAAVEKDTILVRPNATADAILPVAQAGIFPLHTHYVPGVTTNGVYTNPYGGGLVLMIAS